MYALVDSADEDIILSEVEDTLIRMGQYNALLKLCQKRGDHAKVLNIWSKYVFIFPMLAAITEEYYCLGLRMVNGLKRIFRIPLGK